VPDRDGGAIVVWQDFRNNADPDLYGQRISASGASLWATNGVGICAVAGDQQSPCAVPDAGGGVIVVWEDLRTGSDIYSQRVDDNGNILWRPDGEPVCDDVMVQVNPSAVCYQDGVVVSWVDLRNSPTTGHDIYAQRVDSIGDRVWASNGVVVCEAPDNQIRPRITSSADDVVICWSDFRSFDSRIYVQRVDSSGTCLWSSNGVSAAIDSGGADNAQMVADGNGGVILVWEDYRNTIVTPDIYAQRVDVSGERQWGPNGVAVSTAIEGQWGPELVHDSYGGAIIAWEDWRNGGPYLNHDIYAQRVLADGSLDSSTGVDGQLPAFSQIRLDRIYPNPSASDTRIEFSIRAATDVVVDVFDVRGRRVFSDTIVDAIRGGNTYSFTTSQRYGSALPAGIYVIRLTAFGMSVSRRLVLVR